MKTELTSQELEMAKQVAKDMNFELNRKNIDWVLSVKCNIASVNVMLEDYKKLKSDYKYQFWLAVKAELLNMI